MTDFPHAPAIELVGVERDISRWKENVKVWESRENEHKRKLNQPQKDEGLF